MRGLVHKFNAVHRFGYTSNLRLFAARVNQVLTVRAYRVTSGATD